MSKTTRGLFSRRNLPRLIGAGVAFFLFYSYLRCSPYVCPPFARDPLQNGPGYPRAGKEHADNGQQSSNQSKNKNYGHTGYEEPPKNLHTKAIVVSSMKHDDTSWYDEFFPDWERNIYVMDDPRAKLTVAKNKGRESMAYFTYIIDNYHDLPEFTVFLHAQRYQWHNEDPMYGMSSVVRYVHRDWIYDYCSLHY